MHLRKHIRSRLRLATVVAVAAAGLAAGPVVHDASAHSLGGHFPYTRGTWLYLPYTAPAPYAYYPNMTQAASAWYNTPTRLWPYRTSDYNISRVDFYQGNYGTTWYGLTDHKPCFGGGAQCGPYSYANVFLNSQTMGGLSSANRTEVAIHEMGHAFGLAHAAWWDTSIMAATGLHSWTAPRNHDINDTNIEYPYW